MTVPSSKYDDLVTAAARRATITPEFTTHLERRETGWRRFNVMLPPDTHRAFKIASLETGVDMADIAQSLIEAWLENRRRHG